MTGLIDLTYQHEGRWYVLDYKSNRLPRYDAAALHEAMKHSEYDLQALIYTLALHRWLRFRLGDASEIGRASCRERVFTLVSISVVAMTLKITNEPTTKNRQHTAE